MTRAVYYTDARTGVRVFQLVSFTREGTRFLSGTREGERDRDVSTRRELEEHLERGKRVEIYTCNMCACCQLPI